MLYSRFMLVEGMVAFRVLVGAVAFFGSKVELLVEEAHEVGVRVSDRIEVEAIADDFHASVVYCLDVICSDGVEIVDDEIVGDLYFGDECHMIVD